MRGGGIDHAVFSVGPDLSYLTGYSSKPSERITALSVPSDGDPVLFVPLLEAPRVPGGIAEVVAWGEVDDPIAMLASRCQGSRRVAVGDHMWSVFLVGLLSELGQVDLVPGSHVTRALRSVKEQAEVSALRRAARGVDRVLGRIPAEVRFGGRSESEVASDIRRMTLEEGHESAEFTIVASGPNASSPHHDPADRVIREGDSVICDFGGAVDGYYSDVTRTFSVGEASAELTEVHGLVLAANQAAAGVAGPGVQCQEVDRRARSVIDDAGYGDRFVHRTGHGIGLEVHEHPYIVEGNDEVLEPGMAFSIEPGIYLPGKLGVRIEDIVVCTGSGIEVLNQASRELIAVA